MADAVNLTETSNMKETATKTIEPNPDPVYYTKVHIEKQETDESKTQGTKVIFDTTDGRPPSSTTQASTLEETLRMIRKDSQ